MEQIETPTAGGSLPEHLYFERLLAEVSASFVNIPSQLVDGAILDAIRRIVDALGLDLGAVFQNGSQTGEHVPTHQTGAVPCNSPAVVHTARDYPWSYSKLVKGETAAYCNPDDIPDPGERAACRGQGTRSRIALPLAVGGKLAGYIVFWSTREERRWTEDLAGRLELVAQVVAGALARQRADAALQASEERFRTLADNSSAMVWMADPDRRATWFSRRWLEFVGRPIEHELGVGWVQAIHPDDLEPVLSAANRAWDRRVPFTTEYRLRRCDGAWRWVFAYGAPTFNRQGEFEGFLGSVMDITERRLAEEAIRDLTGRLITVQESERARIARELHDDISQQLAGVAIRLSAIKRRSDAQQSPSLQQELVVLQSHVTDVTQSIRHLCQDLHPAVLDHGGLNAALRSHCADFERQHAIRADFNTDEDLIVDDQRMAMCLFRVVQEALRNVARHAGAQSVQVTLRQVQHEIILTITDDGGGFDEVAARANSSGFGLRSIDERVRLEHGRCLIESAPGLGTTVSVVLPFAGAHAVGLE